MSLLQILAPNLGDVGASTADLYLLEAVSFSVDGSTLLVKATFGGLSPEQLRSGVWVYDVANQRYTGCLNTFLSSDVDVSAAQMVAQGGHTLYVAQYALLDGFGETQLALIQDGVAKELGQQLGLDNPIAVERFSLSADGRFLAIQTLDTTLAPINDPDSNEASDIYLIDLKTQQTKRVSFVAGAGVPSDVNLGNVLVTGGRVRVTFSTAAKFSTQDKNDAASAPQDAYQWSSTFDDAGLTGSSSFTLLSQEVSSGLAAGGVQVSPEELMASSAGVWFASTSDAIVAGDSNGAADIFYRPDTGLIQKFGLLGVPSFTSSSQLLSVSADGSYAAVLVDDPSALSAGAPPVPQLLVWQRSTQKWAIVSQDRAGLANADVLSGVLSPNGQWIAFTSMADNLGASDPQALNAQLFLASVRSAFNQAPTGDVTISGTAMQGQTLTASNTLADADVLGTISYQWFADGAAIAGATAATLVLAPGAVGKVISVKASYIDGGATAESVTSAPTVAVASFSGVPVATAASISTNEDTVKTGTLAGVDMDGNTLTFAKVTDPAHGTVTVNAQTGAYTYTPVPNYNGSDSFTFRVNDGMTDSAAVTVAIMVNAVNDLPTGAVTIAGTAKQGQTLTVSNTLADVDGLGAISYQWLADGVAISGATGSALVLAQAQVGKVISVRASYTDGDGNAEMVASSQMASAVVQSFDFSGQVYEWKTHALLSGVSLVADASTVQTNEAGHFDLTSLLHSSLSVGASKVLASSDIHAAITVEDALAALKIAAGRNPNANGAAVSPYQFMAADFNGDGQVTSADALGILKVAQGSSDAPAAQWLFVQESQDFWNDTSHTFATTRNAVTWEKAMQFDAPGTHNLVAVLKGDVNGSWSAPAGAADLDVSNPSYFSDLASRLGVPVTQWGIL